MMEEVGNMEEINLHRVPPIDIESERMCLGWMMADPKLVHYIRQYTGIDDFYRIQHQKIAEIIFSLADQNVNPDPMAVNLQWGERYRDDPDARYLFTLCDSVPFSENGLQAENAIWCAKRVRERADRRRLLKMVYGKYQELLDPTEENDLEAITGDMVSQIFQVRQTTEVVNVSSELREIMNLIESGETFGIPTGFPSLDEFSCGYQKGEFYVLGGRPGMGKTALALKLAMMLCKAGVKTMFVSIEMPIRQLLLRLLSIEAQIPYRLFRQRGAISVSALPKVVMAASEIARWPLYVDDNPGVTIEQIVSRVEAQIFQREMEVIFIDHMHLIPTGNSRNGNEAYSHISLMLKNLSRQMNVPVICLAQLSRSSEGRQDKRPKLSDLRESGSIEQNADNVWFLYRDEYYDRQKNNYNQVQETELIIAKNKSLETGTVHLDFKGAYMEFMDSNKKGKARDNGAQEMFGYEG